MSLYCALFSRLPGCFETQTPYSVLLQPISHGMAKSTLPVCVSNSFAHKTTRSTNIKCIQRKRGNQNINNDSSNENQQWNFPLVKAFNTDSASKGRCSGAPKSDAML